MKYPPTIIEVIAEALTMDPAEIIAAIRKEAQEAHDKETEESQ